MSSEIEIVDTAVADQTSAPLAPAAPDQRPQVPATLDSLSAAPALEAIVERVHATQLVTAALRGRPADCFAVALRGHELGIPIMQALGGDLFIVDGKVGMAAELMRALVVRNGHRIDIDTSTNDTATLSGVRSDTGATASVTWTLEDARRAGLNGPTRNGKPSVWDKYPRAMLSARATSELCRLLFPDVLRGVSYTPEELDSIAPTRNVIPAAVVEHDWPAMGWPDQAAHDEAMTATRTALADADDDTRAALLAAWTAADLAWPLTTTELDGWHTTCANHGVTIDDRADSITDDEPLGTEEPPPAAPQRAALGSRGRIAIDVLDQILDAGKRLDLTPSDVRELGEMITGRPVPDLGLITAATADKLLTALLTQLVEYGEADDDTANQDGTP